MEERETEEGIPKEETKRARKVETLKQPSFLLKGI